MILAYYFSNFDFFWVGRNEGNWRHNATIVSDMKVDVQPGIYVVATSGGVDSMALLDVLAKRSDLKLIAAHFDHGIRHDSHLDRQLVQLAAEKHGIPFVFHEGRLGAGASEDVARRARYKFLHQVRKASGARAVLTAHHHNDALETATLNLLRGTNRKGLTALRSHATVHRPILHVSKDDIRKYAQDQGLVWREDSTNSDTRMLRNYIRHKVLPRLSPEDRKQLGDVIARMRQVNQELDEQLLHYLHLQTTGGTIDRKQFNRLPHSVAREVMAAWLRQQGVREFDQKMIERLAVAGKTFHPGAVTDVQKGVKMRIHKTYLALEHPDR